MKAYLLLFLGYLLLTPLPVATAAAQENNFIRNSAQEEPQTRISQREAYNIAIASYGGKVINIRPDGRFWRVRMDLDGTVVDVLVNAETGAVSRPSK